MMEKTKSLPESIIEEVKQNKYVKIAFYTLTAVATVYALGKAFHLVSKTVVLFKELKEAFKK